MLQLRLWRAVSWRMVTESEGLKRFCGLLDVLRWLSGRVECFSLNFVRMCCVWWWGGWGGRNFMLIAMFINVVRNWDNLDCFFLWRRYIKRFGIVFACQRCRLLSRMLIKWLGRSCGLSWVRTVIFRKFQRFSRSLLMAKLSVTRIFIFFDDFDNGNGIRHWNRLFHCNGLCYLDNFRWKVLFSN